MEGEQHVVKLNSDKGHIFALTSFTKDNINLTLLDKGKAYNCAISCDQLEGHGKSINVTNIKEWAKEAFTISTLDSSSFCFNIVEGKLEWSKLGFEGSKLKISVGKFPVDKIDFQDTWEKVLEASVLNNKALAVKNEDLISSHSKMSDQVKEGRTELKKFVEEKNNLEESLYSKFLPILHAKQEKIKQLMEALKSNDKKENTVDDNMDSYGSGTDIDDDTEPGPSKAAKILDDSQNILSL